MPKERQTCTECSMRRQKCDRNIPCSRCVKRGEPDKCTREWPEEGYDPRKHRIYPRPSKDEEQSAGATEDHNDDDDAASQAVSNDTRAMPGTRATSKTPNLDNGTTVQRRSLNSSTPIDAAEKDGGVLDFLQSGRGNLSDYHVKSFEMLKDPFRNNERQAIPEQELSNGFGNMNKNHLAFLQMLLPPSQQLVQLVEYHLSHVLWYHSCFHGETFYAELQSYMQSPNGLQLRDTDLRWSSLLFSILAGSMVCAKKHVVISWGFSDSDRRRLMRQWYKASIQCLELADYMWRHHLWSVQAACVLTMSGHTLGFSNTQSTLHGAIIKVAQGLGLQRLGPEADDNLPSGLEMTAAMREKTVKRETGRRVWAQICNQDWFSIPFSEMYAISRLHFSTTRFQHLDDHTLLPIPAHEPAATSFSRLLNEIASIMPQAHDAMATSSTLYTKYEQVLHYDAKMKALERESLPAFLSMNEPLRPEWPAWIPWARRSIKLCFAHKTIMIHRSFLGKSLIDTTFDHTRNTCMEVSKVILKYAKEALDDDSCPALWIDQAFVVAAGITLSLDIFHRRLTDPEYTENRAYVQQAICILNTLNHSVVAIRGVRLLTSLLAEEGRLSAQKSMESYNRKRARDAGGSTGASSASPSSFVQPPRDNIFSSGKRQKFDVPKFLTNFVTPNHNSEAPQRANARHNSTSAPTASLGDMNSPVNGNGDLILGNGQLGNVLMQQQTLQRSAAPGNSPFDTQSVMQSGFDALGAPMDYGPDAFEQIFPPHAGISNSFLFEDLLNFEF